MIRMATIKDIDNIVKLRIKLLNEANNNIENYDWDKYSQVLKTFYNDSLSKGKIIAFLAEENEDIVAISMMCFYNITPSLYNLNGKMALITDMYTMPEYRNKAFGMKLLNTVVEHAKKLGYKKVNSEFH